MKVKYLGIIVILVCVSVVQLVWGMSDAYGQNPQHEFGSIRGVRTNSLVPFWRIEGDAAANEEVIRLVPDRQSKRGGMWNSQVNEFTNWEITYRIRVHGVSILGADGMAFWYSRFPATGGPFFGYTDKFNGIGVILDTYDNDNSGLHPLLIAVFNDGSKQFRHEHPTEGEEGGGVHLKSDMEVGNCQFQIRNRDSPSVVVVRYKDGKLSVAVAINENETPKECVSEVAVDIPVGYYFGFTAATGQLADNHDIYGFAIKNLDEDASSVDSQRVFSSYDKYQLSEQLSKIQLELNYASKQGKPQSFTEGEQQVAKLGTDVWEQLHRVEDIGADISSGNEILRKVESRLANLEQQISSGSFGSGNGGEPREGGAGGVGVGSQEIEDVKREVEGMHGTLKSIVSTISGMEESMRELKEGNRVRGEPRDKDPRFPNVFKREGASIPNSNNNNNANAFGDTIFGTLLTVLFWVVVVVVVLVMAIAFFVIWKRKRDRQKKYF